ncbi:MAG: rod shape-determining protein MreD [Anditalea sp.]
MNSKIIISSITGFFVYFLVQVFVLKNLVIFDMAFCFLYVFYILLLPIETKTIPLMLISFILGISIDIFYDSLGMHTASMVALAFARNAWIRIIIPTGGYDENVQPSILNMGIGWFFTYSLPLILLHHVIFFYIDYLGTDLYLPMVNRILSSASFVWILGIMVQMLFYKRKRGI